MSQLEHITPEQIAEYGVVAAPDRLTGNAQNNKAIFDRLVRELVAKVVNDIIDKTNVLLTDESVREKNEEERISAENQRVSAENTRTQNESARVQAENERVFAEQERVSAEQQREQAEDLRESATSGIVVQATAQAQDAKNSADLSESWAVGGTGIRTGEDTNNAKYWSQQAQHAAGGGVTSFKNRSGVVVPQTGDYTASQIKTEDGENVETALSNKVEKGSPQMYPLPFVDGVSEYRLCRYFKTQNNIVHIFGEAKFTNGISGDNENVFVLPTGYRPISHILSPATYWWSDDTRCAGALMVGPDGYVTARISPYDIKAGLTTNIFFHTTFLAQE